MDASQIQTELIDVLPMFVKRKIVSEINNDSSGDTFIGVISDETSDISRISDQQHRQQWSEEGIISWIHIDR